MFPCRTANRINRIAAMQGPLSPTERRAAIRLIDHETALEFERARYAGGGGYDRATRLMKPLLFLRESRRAYNCFLRETTVRVDPKKKCFVIRKSPPAVPGCRNKINKKGDLTIGFGYGRSPRLPATLAQAKKHGSSSSPCSVSLTTTCVAWRLRPTRNSCSVATTRALFTPIAPVTPTCHL